MKGLQSDIENTTNTTMTEPIQRGHSLGMFQYPDLLGFPDQNEQFPRVLKNGTLNSHINIIVYN